jgi:hypothetical protein
VNVLEYRHAFGDFLPHTRKPETQRNWNTILKAFDGVPLTDAELPWFQENTGRRAPLPGGFTELVAIVGRQAGKDDICADIGNANAVQAIVNNEDVDGQFISFIAQDHRSSVRTLFHRVSRPWVKIPELRQHVASQTADTIVLDNGLTLAAFPCRPAALRGLRNRRVAMNEADHYHSTEGNPVAVEMRRAVLPTLSTTGGKLVIASSPYLATGLLAELRRRHYGNESSTTLVVQASAPEMNPTLPADYLQRMEQDDPDAYRSEVLGEFRLGTSALFPDPSVLESCTAEWRELPPSTATRWYPFMDISSMKNDASALALSYRDGHRTVVGLVRTWPAKVSTPESVAAEMSGILRAYGCHTVTGDRYAIGFVEQTLRRHGITFEPSDLDRSRLYLELLPRVLSGSVTWPNDRELGRQLRSLERRRGFAGRDRVDARGGAAHEDTANALAGSVHVANRAQYGGGEATPVSCGSGAGLGLEPNTNLVPSQPDARMLASYLKPPSRIPAEQRWSLHPSLRRSRI